MVNTKKWLIHFSFFYKFTEVPAIVIIYVRNRGAGVTVSCIYRTYKQPLVPLYHRVWSRSLFILCASFLSYSPGSTCFFFARGHSAQEGIHFGQEIPNFIIPGEGVSLGFVYLIWICIVLCLYPICKWFSEYKRTHTDWWLSYL